MISSDKISVKIHQVIINIKQPFLDMKSNLHHNEIRQSDNVQKYYNGLRFVMTIGAYYYQQYYLLDKWIVKLPKILKKVNHLGHYH